MTEEYIPFEQRWMLLLDETRRQLKTLDKSNKTGHIKELWTSINKFVSIMAVPKEVMPKARRTLLKMACKAPWGLMCPIFLYAMMLFLPRNWYRNVSTQHWFKQRLGA